MTRRAAGLSTLLYPRSIAVVGASNNPDKVGGRPLRHLMSHGFDGALYPITRHGTPVQGLTSYTRLDELPEVPDVAILSVPANRARSDIEVCARLGVRNVLLFSSGFAEIGEEGRAEQNALTDLCREAGVRLLGPNTIGVANFSNGAVLSFASIYLDVPYQDGPVAIASQSGAFGVSAYASLRNSGIGVRYVCTTGNQSDIDIADFIAEVVLDPQIRVLLLYLEQIDDDAALRCALDSARESGIAVAAVIAGTSSHGRRSASLHTGSAGIDGARAADLFRGCGCRLAPSLPELCDSVPLYLSEYAHALPSNGIAIVSNSGASCVLACDVAERLGLPIATLSEASRSALDALLPSFSLNRNPVDLTAMLLTDPGLLGRAIEVVLADPAVDMAALGLLAIGGPSYDVPRFARECAAAARRFGKPCVVHSPDERVRTMFVREGCAVFGCEQAAMEALRDLRVHIKTYPTGRANLHAVI